MKQILPVLLVMFLASCAGSGAEQKKTTDAGETEKPAQNSAGGSCSNLPLFHNGASIETATYDGEGVLQGGQISKIAGVKNEGNFTIAEADVSTKTIKGMASTYQFKYKCDGNNIYWDINSLLQAMTQAGGGTVEASEMSFPIQLTQGQKLPDASFNITMGKGKQITNMAGVYTNRTVELKEKVETDAGSWDCYKVTADVNTKIEMTGMDPRMQSMMEEAMKKKGQANTVIWFSPRVGIVKCEVYYGKKMTSKTILKKITN